MPRINNTGEIGGGQDGEHEESFGSPFFHPGVKATRFKNTKKGARVFAFRLLPAFDYSIPTDDPAFKTSWVPYRDRDDIDPKTNFGKFTKWYFSLIGHEYVGSEMQHFLSPLSTCSRRERGIDPLYDIWLVAKNHSNPDWKKLTEKPEGGKKGAVISEPKNFIAVNGLLQKDGAWENQIGLLTKMGMKEFKHLLNIERAAKDEVITPEWEDFRFGDPTDPATGLQLIVKDTNFGEAGMSTFSFHFSDSGNSLRGITKLPADDPYFLENRFNIKDMANVTKIWSAEQILEYVVADGVIPYDLIVEACSKHWTVPGPQEGTSYGGHAEDPDDDPDNTLGDTPAPAARTVVAARPAVTAARAVPAAVARPAVAASAARPAVITPARAVPAAARPAAAVVTPASAARPAVSANRSVSPAQRPASVAAAPAASRSPATPASGRPQAVQRAVPAAVAPPVEAAPPVVEAPPDEVPADTVPAPLSQQEVDDYNHMTGLLDQDANALDAAQMAYYMSLADRVSAEVAAPAA